MRATFAAATDVGRKRTNNEDSYLADARLGLFLVADGMGGHAAGEIAAQTVADAIHQFIRETHADPDPAWPFTPDSRLSWSANRLRTAVLVANRRLSQRIDKDGRLKGMATTLSAMLLDGDRLTVSHVGDCRAYLIRDGRLEQITLDHSWVAEQVRGGLMTVDDAKVHPWRSVVTRALSGDAELAVDMEEMIIQPGDLLLLCSDGLYGVLSDEEILEVVVHRRTGLEDCCQDLVDAANRRGGLDNVTTVLVEISRDADVGP